MWTTNLYVVFFFFYFNIKTNLGITVKYSDGTILGTEETTANKTSFYAFRQVPFAAPPIGKLRFQAPEPPIKWNGVLNTTKNTKICYQMNTFDEKENEDCLYLNVYSPGLPPSVQDLPVIVYVHGGAFIEGDSVFESTGPQFLLDYNIIVVTVQYRLGAFGFISTEDNVIPGNNGLKDILAALNWIQKNIAIFGGDPNKVTLAGQSAGAALVGYHVISEKSAGLFRAAIMESGSPLCSWSYQRYSKKYAYQLATAIDSGFTTSNSSKELLNLLQEISASDINNAKFEGPTGLQLGQGDVFAPVIEVAHENAFITDFMHTRLLNGQINRVPTLMGVNSEELINLASDLDYFNQQMSLYDDNISLIVNHDYNIQAKNLITVGSLIRNIYTKDLFHDNPGAAIKFRSDLRYTTAVSMHAALQSNYSDVYFYVFGFHGYQGSNVEVEGSDRVGHSEELTFLWRDDNNWNLTKYPEDDLVTHYRMLQMWTDFVTTLNPTSKSINLLQNIEWPLVTPTNFSYLNIEKDLEIRQNPKKLLEWRKVIDVYGNPPFDTY